MEAEKPITDVTLDACFDEFSKEEQLGVDDAWYCPRCKKHQQATKKLDIWKLPDVLVVHLKRFSHSRYRRDKIENVIGFPLSGLDLSDRVHGPHDDSEPLLYDLYAVSNHFGGLGGGHYTAYAKNKVDQKWYDFDDSSVSPMDENGVISRAAYVLYFQRRRPGMESAPMVLPAPPKSVVQDGGPVAHDGGNPFMNGVASRVDGKQDDSDADSTIAQVDRDDDDNDNGDGMDMS